MPKLFTKKERAAWYAYLVLRDGEKCNQLLDDGSRCGRTPPEWVLEIDHIDNSAQKARREKGAYSNNSPDNLHLLCKSHNRKKNPSRHKGDLQGTRTLKRNREIDKEDQIQTIFDYTDAPATMRKGTEAQQRFRTWILHYLEVYDNIEVQEALNSGAEIANCSQQAIQGYMKRITSQAGPCMVKRNDLGEWVLVARPQDQRMMYPLWPEQDKEKP